MKRIKWQMLLGLGLVALSAVCYAGHYLIFGDAHHIFIYFVGDIKRAYGVLISEWPHYLDHLRTDYPYLFSLALRTNPFDPQASVEFS